MDLTKVWIGERLRILSSGKSGTFEGINKEGKARVRVLGKILLVNGSNLEIIPEVEYFPDINDILQDDGQSKSQKTKIAITFDHTLDLHIEKLAPYMEKESASRILEFQLQKSEHFIRQAIERNYPHITIIHGKGQGVLKKAIEHQLQQFHQVRLTFTKNGGGAVEVWL
jgi:dsDNA-specific endonuclease/ATPase MutS2